MVKSFFQMAAEKNTLIEIDLTYHVWIFNENSQQAHTHNVTWKFSTKNRSEFKYIIFTRNYLALLIKWSKENKKYGCMH
jgi:hypothetical protein